MFNTKRGSKKRTVLWKIFESTSRTVHFGSNFDLLMAKNFCAEFFEFTLRPAFYFLGKKVKLTDLFICNNVVIKSGK